MRWRSCSFSFWARRPRPVPMPPTATTRAASTSPTPSSSSATSSWETASRRPPSLPREPTPPPTDWPSAGDERVHPDLEDRFADLEDRFAGSLLGLALGDALGAPHEGGIAGQAVWWLLGFGKRDLLRWTDDTEMAMGLAESLIEKRGLNADHLAALWAERADWKRGYGAGTRKLLGIVRAGTPWREASRAVFPEGSFGNGAAMRAAPLGLFFHRDQKELCRAAKLASSITHAHALGIDGGLLIARATAMALV